MPPQETLVAELTLREQKKTAAAQAAYRRLVIACVDGNGPTAIDEAAEILMAAQKTVIDLNADMAVATNRRAWREQIAAAEATCPASVALREERARIEQRLVAAEDAFHSRAEEIDRELARIEVVMNRGAEARRRLFDSVGDVDPDLFAAYNEASEAWGHAHELVLAIRQSLVADQVESEAKALGKKLVEKIKRLEKRRPTGWKADCERFGRIVADPLACLRGRREPKLAQAEPLSAATFRICAELPAASWLICA
jgi:hypothetical protein